MRFLTVLIILALILFFDEGHFFGKYFAKQLMQMKLDKWV